MKAYTNYAVILVGFSVADLTAFMPIVQFFALTVTIVYTVVQTIYLLIKIKKKKYE